jgi:hypothetical protein
MAKSVRKLLEGLSFVGGPVETLYLNETRAREGFTTQLGAIESFTRTATKTIKGEAPVVKIGADLESGSGINWKLTDPITQVLVLRAALESKGLLYDIDNAAQGRYARFAGTGFISRPGPFGDMHRKRLAGYPGLYESLEAERAEAEDMSRMLGSQKPDLWLLTLDNGAVVCQAILSVKWIRGTIRHWLGIGAPWEIFGLVREVRETGVPNLAAIHVNIKW